MSYTVDVSNTLITLDAGTTETSLAGLTGLTDGTNPIVTTAGGDLSGNDGEVKVYTVKNPYRINVVGSLTISPETEMLFMENTVQVDSSNDFKADANSTLIINGKFIESWGTWYSKNTWIRFNRRATSSFRTTQGLMDFHAKATVTWEGGLSAGYGVIGVQGSTTASQNKPKIFRNATHSGLHTNMFNIHRVADVTFDNFSVIGNRFVDNRENVTITDYTCTNSLLEGGNGQTYVNYEGNTQAVSWNRSQKIRTFTNSKAGMSLNITPWQANATQRGGQTTLRKSGTLTIVDKDKTALSGAKVSIRTYDDGNRIDWANINYGTDTEHARYLDQTSVVNLTGASNSSGEFPFDAIMKQFTQRSTFELGLSNVSGAFSRGDNVVYTSGSTGAPAVVTAFDAATNKLYVFPSTNKYADPAGSVVNSTQSGSATIVSRDNATSNYPVRYTKGASDAAQLQDCVTITYLNNLTTTELDYAGKFGLVANIFNLPDGFITNTDAVAVGNYTVLENNEKVYDFLKLYLFNNWLQENSTICTFSGGFLDFGTNTIVLSATQVAPLSTVGSTYFLGIGSGKFVGNIKAASVSLIDGATTSGIINSGGVITLPDLNVSITNIIAGSRLQIFNVTTGLEVKNEIVAGTTYTEAYQEGTGYSAGNVIRVRLTNAITTTAYLGLETTVIATATGWGVLASQQLDTVYNSIGINGATVTKFSADYTGIDAELNIAQNFTMHEFYVWWVYNETTAQSIRQFFGGVTALNIANIRINVDVLSLYLDSTVNTSVRQTDNVRIFRSDLAYPVKQPTTSGYGLDVKWQSEVFIAGVDVNVPALTSAQSTQLGNIVDVLADTNELQANQGNFATATGFSTFNPTTDTVANVTLTATTTNLTNGASGGGLTSAQAAELTGIKSKTDSLTFEGTEVKADLSSVEAQLALVDVNLQRRAIEPPRPKNTRNYGQSGF